MRGDMRVEGWDEGEAEGEAEGQAEGEAEGVLGCSGFCNRGKPP